MSDQAVEVPENDPEKKVHIVILGGEGGGKKAEGRVIGLRHRIKKTAEGESRPTQVFILDKETGKSFTYELENDQAELDFVKGIFPVKMRKVRQAEDISKVPPHHVKWIKQPEDDNTSMRHLSHMKIEDGEILVPVEVPESYDGLMPGDMATMVLGGSGDRVAYAISRRGAQIGAKMFRIAPFRLQDLRGKDSKEDDSELLARLVSGDTKNLFEEIRPRDQALIRVREALQLRIETMKSRIGCEQRFRQQFISRIFCSEAGFFPEGSIELEYDKAKASYPILQHILREEKVAENSLKAELGKLDVYTQLFEKVEGIGPLIASRIIAAVIDIRRYRDAGKLKAYCGVHVETAYHCSNLECDYAEGQKEIAWKRGSVAAKGQLCPACGWNVVRKGIFARKRAGKVANWHGDARQALYLIGDQCNRRPNSYWGKVLRYYKAKMRKERMRCIVEKNGKQHPLIEGKWEFKKTCKVPQPDGTEVKKASVYVLMQDDGTKLYITDAKQKHSDMHIHKTALWRTVTKFVEWLFVQWNNLEKGLPIKMELERVDVPLPAVVVPEAAAAEGEKKLA